MQRVKTLEEAYEFVQEVGLCGIFSGKVKGAPALWDVVDLPVEGGGNTKWGARVEAVWAWKNELPAAFPDEVFYGKAPGGHAVLMSMTYLRETHYPKLWRPVSTCGELARGVYEILRLSPGETGELRAEAVERLHCSKSQFDTALKRLQVTLNVARSNEPGLKKDTWLPFTELYPEFEELQARLAEELGATAS